MSEINYFYFYLDIAIDTAVLYEIYLDISI